MVPQSRRRAPGLFMPALGAALVLGIAGCADNSPPSDKVTSLADLPNKDRSMLKIGQTAQHAGDCAAATRFYQLALDNNKDDAEAESSQLGIAACQLATGKLPEAQRGYEAAMKLAPEDAAPLLGLGRVYLVEHEPAKAVPILNMAIQKGAGGPQAWNDKGVALDQLLDHKQAQEAYRAGLARYPGDRALRNNLALSLAVTGGLSEAESILRGLAAEPEATARTRQNLALILGLEGKAAEARAESREDLDGAALDNNAYFYNYARAMLTGAPAPPPPSVGSPPATADEGLGEARPAEPRRTVVAIEKPAPAIRAKAPPADNDHAASIKAEAAANDDAPPPAAPHPVLAKSAPISDPPSETLGAEVAASKTPNPAIPVAATQTVEAVPRLAGPVASSETP